MVTKEIFLQITIPKENVVKVYKDRLKEISIATTEELTEQLKKDNKFLRIKFAEYPEWYFDFKINKIKADAFVTIYIGKKIDCFAPNYKIIELNSTPQIENMKKEIMKKLTLLGLSPKYSGKSKTIYVSSEAPTEIVEKAKEVGFIIQQTL